MSANKIEIQATDKVTVMFKDDCRNHPLLDKVSSLMQLAITAACVAHANKTGCTFYYVGTWPGICGAEVEFQVHGSRKDGQAMHLCPHGPIENVVGMLTTY